MDEVNIVQRTNATFVQTFALGTWCDLYDLSSGHWHAMLRKQVASAVAHYEWSTEAGNLTYEETRAYGEITFTLNPEVEDTVMIGATIIQFGMPGGVVIGASLAITLANLLAFLRASDDDDILRCNYDAVTGTVLVIEYKTSGTLGNRFVFDTDVAGASTSGDTLIGGGAIVTLEAPMEDMSSFSGDYVYDLRWQSDVEKLYVPMVGGTITFETGITRDVQEPTVE